LVILLIDAVGAKIWRETWENSIFSRRYFLDNPN
jgi:hypothetical protein